MALPWGIPTSAAQDAGRFRGMDTDRDGIITRSEWRGSTQSFRIHDWNNDGVLSGDEVRPGATREGRWDDEDFDPQSSDRVTDWTVRGFNGLDHNRDGRITRNEWHYDVETFRRVDRDNNNSISRAEYLGGDEDDDRGDQFEYLDVDNSRAIEWEEWHGSRVAFNRLDRNRDGVISQREMTGSDVVAAGSNQFASLDWNRNGVISVDEWHWSRSSFDQRDLNRDGVLTRREFEATSGLGNTTDVARASTEVRDVRVDARDRWTSTGLYVRAGDLVSWQASGTISMSGPNDTATPAGSTTGRHAPNSPIRDASAGGLLMKVGDAVVRFAGSSGSFRANSSGEIFFGVNDDHLADNSGEYRVRVTIGQ